MGKGFRHESAELHPKVVYQPKFHENEVYRFKKFVEDRCKIKLNDYWDLYEWSCKNYPEFWECIWHYYGIVSSQPYTEIFDRRRNFTNMEWFKGARLNFAENILKTRSSKTALIVTDDYDNVEYITYQQLYDEVNVYVHTLKDLGIQKKDKICCYMSNKKEAIFAYLATASIGAIWSGALPLSGPKAVLSRLQQIAPKILFTGGNFYFEDKEIRMDEKIPSVVEGLPTLEKVVFVPSKPEEEEVIRRIPKCCSITDFLKPARDKLQKSPQDIEFEQVPFDYPCCISFTSGTTGLPKGLIHSTGVFLVSLKDFGLHHNCNSNDVLINFSPVGWVSWHMYLNSLIMGLTLIVYEGDPFQKTPTRFWDLVDKFGITASYIWSSTAAEMELRNYVPTPKHSLKTLKQLIPMGSPAKPHSFEFLANKIKPDLFCSPGYGLTEFFGMVSGLDSNLPVYKGEVQAFGGLGTDVRCLNEKGQPVFGERGDLVVTIPSPGLPICLLNDENKQKVTETYLSKYPGYWDLGDDGWINPVTKGLIIYGRSDETMNPKGARFNCAEIYFALDSFPGLFDSVCVSHYNDSLDERVILFVKMMPGVTLTSEIKDQIRDVIEKDLTFEHVPDIIMEVPDIPYNMTGKKLNGLVKKLINKRPVTNVGIVVNPTSVDFFRNLDLGDF